MLVMNFDPYPILTTERLVLRRPALADDKETFFLRSDDEANKYIDRPRAQTIDDARQFLQKLNAGIDKNEWISWVINRKGDNTLLGSVCFWNIDKETGAGEIGFELHSAAQGQGIMTEAVERALAYAFEVMRLTALTGWVHKDNVRSVRLMERFGFVRDHTEEEKHAGKDYFSDTEIYKLVNKSL